MKKFFAQSIAIALMLSLFVGCSAQTTTTTTTTSGTATTTGTSTEATTEVENTFNLKLGTIRADDDPATIAVQAFAELVEEKTNGTVKVTVYNNSALGGLTDMLPGMLSGTIDMMHDRISCYGTLEGAEKFNITAAPFIWSSYDELEGFMNSDAVQTWFDEAAAASGVRVFMAKGETEARQLSSNVPVYSADDFEGLKIRTAEIPVVQQTMQALGAEPVVISLSDLYMSLRQGTADAQENGFLTIQNQSFYEVQEYLMKTDYIRDIGAYFVSENIWNQFSDAQRAAVIEAASEAAEIETQLTNEMLQESIDFLSENMTYIDVDLDSIYEKLGDEIYQDFDDAGIAWETGAYAVVKAYKDGL